MSAATSNPVFIVRRARWYTTANLALGLGFLGFTAASLVHQIRAGEAWILPLSFVVFAAFYCWQVWVQFRHRKPLIEISAAGLGLPGASPAPIPWSRIWRIEPGRGLPGLSGGRINFQVDADTFIGLRLGQRFMGDVVVRNRRLPNSFSVITQGLEERTDAIYAAIKRYWPPDTDNATR
ncbi:MAG TPA: hypothetical protein VF342_15150 [Alphaproteobacteria bacterium]